MRSAPLAIAWELWAKNRLGLSVIGTGLLVLAGLSHVLSREAMAGISVLLCFVAFLYLASVFVYAEVSPGANSPGFPAWKFTLPWTTASLVAWPMLYGMAAVTLFWLVLVYFVWLPCGLIKGMFWPAVPMLAAILACLQAVAWLPLRSHLARLLLAAWVVPALASTLVWISARLSLAFEGEETVDVILRLVAWQCACLVPIAYAVAFAGVCRERRGGAWGWAWLQRRWESVGARRRARPFSSAARAQLWVERRQQGILLPGAMCCFVLLLGLNISIPISVIRGLVAVAVLPLLFGFFVGFGTGKASFWAPELRLSSFTATRPCTNHALAVAKLRAAARTAVLTWLVVLPLALVWVVFSGNSDLPTSGWQWLVDVHGPAWAGAIVCLAVASLLVMTWMQLAAGMALSLTGRAAVVNGAVLIYLAFAGALIWLGVWTLFHPDFYDTFLTACWGLAGLATLGKLFGLAWAVGAMRREGLLAWRVQWGLFGIWLAGVACVASLVWLLLAGGPLPAALIALGLVLTFPLTRWVGLPLALAWNRHR